MAMATHSIFISRLVKLMILPFSMCCSWELMANLSTTRENLSLGRSLWLVTKATGPIGSINTSSNWELNQ